MTRRPRSVLRLAACLVAGVGFAACGARSLLAPFEPAGAGGHTGAGAGGATPKQDAGAPDAEPGMDAGTGGGPACQPDGDESYCLSPDECCNGLCNDAGYCGAVPCLVETSPCTYDAECCGQHCQPSFQTARCLDCALAGQPCSGGDGGADAGLACCYAACSAAGYCPFPPCVPNGEPVHHWYADTCCSHYERGGYCASSVCAHDDAPCASITDCCTNACTGGRCGDGGVVPCHLPGDTCAATSDCCAFDCNAAGVCGPDGCGADGQPCAAAADCCSERCDPSGTCVANPCAADATPCTTGSDCCSGYCVEGYCNAQSCLGVGMHCTVDGSCCADGCSAQTSTCGGIILMPPPL